MDELQPWAIVLAGGDGMRLRSCTRRRDGTVVPKQYCRFGDHLTLLGRALARARGVAAPRRILTVVAEAHRRWWSRELPHRLQGGAIVQPANRGTAAGLLLPLLHVAREDPEAPVVALPSDHGIQREEAFLSCIRRCLDGAREGSVVLLGLAPAGLEPGYGWIVPAAGWPGELRPVERFVEKPGRPEMAALVRSGALWSTFVLAGRARALLQLFEAAQPAWFGEVRRLTSGVDLTGASRPSRGLRALYGQVEPLDASRDVLSPKASALRVLAAPSCGWSDLGTPERLRAWRRARRSSAAVGARRSAGLVG